jgi:hypothetical protein
MRPKKVSGRWGFRPLGRGDGGKRNLKLFLTSRRYAALASSTTANRSSLNCPGSDQLPITIAIVLRSCVSVDSSVVPSHPVLSAPCFRTDPEVPSYRRPHTREWQSSHGRSVRLYPSKFLVKRGSRDGFRRLYACLNACIASTARHFPLRYVILPFPCMT